MQAAGREGGHRDACGAQECCGQVWLVVRGGGVARGSREFRF
jgi:hypothetical protein